MTTHSSCVRDDGGACGGGGGGDDDYTMCGNRTPPLQRGARLLHAAANTTTTTATTTTLQTALLHYAEHTCTSTAEWAVIQQRCAHLDATLAARITVAIDARAHALAQRAMTTAATQRARSDALLRSMNAAAAAAVASGAATCSGVSLQLQTLLSSLTSSSSGGGVSTLRDLTTTTLTWVLGGDDDDEHNNNDNSDDEDVGALDAMTLAQAYGDNAYVQRTLRAAATLSRSFVTRMRATAACMRGSATATDGLRLALHDGLRYVERSSGDGGDDGVCDIRRTFAQLELMRSYVVLLCADAAASPSFTSAMTELPVARTLSKAAAYVSQLQRVLYGDVTAATAADGVDSAAMAMRGGAAAGGVVGAADDGDSHNAATAPSSAAAALRRQWACHAAVRQHYRVCVDVLEEYAVFFHVVQSFVDVLAQRFDRFVGLVATATPSAAATALSSSSSYIITGTQQDNNNNGNTTTTTTMARLSALAALVPLYGVVRFPALQRVLLARDAASGVYLLLDTTTTTNAATTTCARVRTTRPLAATLYHAAPYLFTHVSNAAATTSAATAAYGASNDSKTTTTTTTTTSAAAAAAAVVPVAHVTHASRAVLPSVMGGCVAYMPALVAAVLMPCDAFAALLLLCSVATLPLRRVLDDVVALNEVQAMLLSQTSAVARATRALVDALARGALGEAWQLAQAVVRHASRRALCGGSGGSAVMDTWLSSLLCEQLLVKVKHALCYQYLRISAVVPLARATRQLRLHAAHNDDDDGGDDEGKQHHRDNNIDDDDDNGGDDASQQEQMHALMDVTMQLIRERALRGRVDCVHHVYTNVDVRALVERTAATAAAAKAAAEAKCNNNDNDNDNNDDERAALAALTLSVLRQTDVHVAALQRQLRLQSLRDHTTQLTTSLREQQRQRQLQLQQQQQQQYYGRTHADTVGAMQTAPQASPSLSSPWPRPYDVVTAAAGTQSFGAYNAGASTRTRPSYAPPSAYTPSPFMTAASPPPSSHASLHARPSSSSSSSWSSLTTRAARSHRTQRPHYGSRHRRHDDNDNGNGDDDDDEGARVADLLRYT